MEAMTLIELIPSLGFPIIVVIFLGWFIYKIYQDTTRQNAENMEAVQARCAERESWLHGVVEEAHATNAKFAEVIAKYDSKLDKIQEDVSEIKTDIMEIKSHNN